MAVHYRAVSELAADLGVIPANLRAVLRPKLREAGEVIAAKAKSNASWSTRIPGAISVSQSFGSRTGGVVVRVDPSKDAPHARPYEGRSGAVFRHPVFGNRDVWVDQAARPFLGPAARTERAKAVALIAEGVAAATRNL